MKRPANDDELTPEQIEAGIRYMGALRIQRLVRAQVTEKLGNGWANADRLPVFEWRAK